MATVIIDTPCSPNPTADTTPSKAKPGRQSRFSPSEDLVVVREVVAANAHVTTYGETRARFEQAAERCNASTIVVAPVTWKSVRDRYKRIKEQFDKADNANQKMSGVGGDIGEMEELLMKTRHKRDDIAAEKTAEKDAQRQRDDEKERIGNELMVVATKRKSKETAEVHSDSDGEVAVGRSVKKSKKRAVRNIPEDGLASFVMNLCDADLARISLERERLTFERERAEADRAERQRDREERAKEWTKTQELELAKYKLMMETIAAALNKK